MTVNHVFTFGSLPTLEELRQQLSSLSGPFSIQIEQDGPRPRYYNDIIDCDTVDELHEFLAEELDSDIEFTLDIEEVRPDDFNDHPSLTAQERNPSLK